MNKKSKSNSHSLDGERGIDNLSQLIKFIIIAIQKITTVDGNKDKKISLLEGLTLITSLGFKIPAAYNAFPEAILEWRDISEAELQQLAEQFKEDFDLPGLEDGRIKALIKKAIDVIVDNYNHVQDICDILDN